MPEETVHMLWTTLWVDSIDRPNWMQRVREMFSIPGVDKVLPDARSGQVRIHHNPDMVTTFQLSSHLRAAGL